MVSDEERARLLIGLLRHHFLDHGQTYKIPASEIPAWLGCSQPEAIAAMIFAKNREWIYAFNEPIIPGSILIHDKGMAEAGRAPRQPEAPVNIHFGDVVQGNKAELHGAGSLRQSPTTQDTRSHVPLLDRLKNFLGLGP